MLFQQIRRPWRLPSSHGHLGATQPAPSMQQPTKTISRRFCLGGGVAGSTDKYRKFFKWEGGLISFHWKESVSKMEGRLVTQRRSGNINLTLLFSISTHHAIAKNDAKIDEQPCSAGKSPQPLSTVKKNSAANQTRVAYCVSTILLIDCWWMCNNIEQRHHSSQHDY